MYNVSEESVKSMYYILCVEYLYNRTETELPCDRESKVMRAEPTSMSTEVIGKIFGWWEIMVWLQSSFWTEGFIIHRDQEELLLWKHEAELAPGLLFFPLQTIVISLWPPLG